MRCIHQAAEPTSVKQEQAVNHNMRVCPRNAQNCAFLPGSLTSSARPWLWAGQQQHNWKDDVTERTGMDDKLRIHDGLGHDHREPRLPIIIIPNDGDWLHCAIGMNLLEEVDRQVEPCKHRAA